MHNIIIIGAGPAGLSLACSLSKLDLKITMIEKQDKKSLASPSYDGREIAMTHFSKHLLSGMNVWQRIPENSISLVKEAKVLDGNSPYALHFDYRQVCDDTLGYIVSNHNIRKALYEEVKTRDNVKILCGNSVKSINTSETEAAVTLENGKVIDASLIVAADSRFSTSRRNMGISAKMKDFGKIAIVCTARHELPHDDTAYECFRYGSTLALLPLPGDESSVVITVSADKAAHILEQTPEEFIADVSEQFDNRFGEMELSSERFSYPLVATYADKFVGQRFAVVGDAAVGMHPVTAHGFNLGLKGQSTLSSQIKNALESGLDIAAESTLRKYNQKHIKDSKPIYLATNAIVQLYNDDRAAPRLLRKTLLRLGNRITPARKAIMHQLTEIEKVA